jgi:hypothetical protein
MKRKPLGTGKFGINGIVCEALNLLSLGDIKFQNFVFKDVCGKAGVVNKETVTEWAANLSSPTDDCEPKDIANDDAGLYSRAHL